MVVSLPALFPMACRAVIVERGVGCRVRRRGERGEGRGEEGEEKCLGAWALYVQCVVVHGAAIFTRFKTIQKIQLLSVLFSSRGSNKTRNKQITIISISSMFYLGLRRRCAGAVVYWQTSDRSQLCLYCVIFLLWVDCVNFLLRSGVELR